MKLTIKAPLKLTSDAKNFINLYESLGERAENFIPISLYEELKTFTRLCSEEAFDPVSQQLEINKRTIFLKESIPGYIDIALMLFPHENSKAYEFSALRKNFTEKLQHLKDIELIEDTQKAEIDNILKSHDFSIGTPPVTESTIHFLYKTILGETANELRKFRDIIGIGRNAEQAQWDYLIDVLDQMIVQSAHYTNQQELSSFLTRMASTVNFKGLNGFIRTVVSGGANTAVQLISEELFNQNNVEVIQFDSPQKVYEQITQKSANIYIIKANHLRTNPFSDPKWFPHLSRIIIVDDSPESKISNTSLVFAFHNLIINALKKVHNKKLGAPANTQLNLRLILEKVNMKNITLFRKAAQEKIKDYEAELKQLKQEQLVETDHLEQDTILYKFDEFSRQILMDKYALSKLASFLVFIEAISAKTQHKQVNDVLAKEFEERMKSYFYGGSGDIKIAAIVEGGGRNQIKTYGDYILQAKSTPLNKEINHRCAVILDVLPNCYERTLKNHFHKNFGLNLFLERYKEYLIKAESNADSGGRLTNLLLDLGIEQKYSRLKNGDKKIINEFIADLGTMEITSISDDVQMIIRDIALNQTNPKPFIFLNQQAAWDYKDLFPIEKFDLNPFDIEIELDTLGKIDYERFLRKLQRIKGSFQLFDESGKLWDRFCSNSTILINDPSNPSGLSDFNESALLKFLKFISSTQITLFLDEAYNDAIKIDEPSEPKWRTISNYIVNNINAYSRISMVASLSTTKNLGATGERLGAIAATSSCEAVIDFAVKGSDNRYGNSSSLYMLVNVLETAQQAKKIKKEMDENLPKDASRNKIKNQILSFMISEIDHNSPQTITSSKNARRESLFEGSPLHIFLLEELLSLDKLDVLELPDDFKYRGEAFFNYYKTHLVKALNKFRINRIFRSESNKRMTMVKKNAGAILSATDIKGLDYIDSDGSYLFNLTFKEYFSYLDLEKFAKRLAMERGLAAIPYPNGFVRFSLGGYIKGDEHSYTIFENEFENALKLFLTYWRKFVHLKSNKNLETEDALDQIFSIPPQSRLTEQILADFMLVKSNKKEIPRNLRINEIKTMYHPFPEQSGVCINSIPGSDNAVFEFGESVGSCSTLIEFINSDAFSKIYENLLPQVSKHIPLLKGVDIHTVLAKYGKSTLLKYITSKIDFQPDHHLLDDIDEKLIMIEILIELESILFSDSKFKILTLQAASGNSETDKAKLEGYNAILKKYIKELLLHFNLPFEQRLSEPTKEELFHDALQILFNTIGVDLNQYEPDLLFTKIEEKVIKELTEEKTEFGGAIQRYFHQALKNTFKKKTAQINPFFIAYMLLNDHHLTTRMLSSLSAMYAQLENHKEADTALFVERMILSQIERELSFTIQQTSFKIADKKLAKEIRKIVLFLTTQLNVNNNTLVFNKYNHILIKIISLQYFPQNSSKNEMIQHGVTIYENPYAIKNRESENLQSLHWTKKIMQKCGVIANQQPIQVHTRMNTDAKKREYPFHKVNRTESHPLGKDNSSREFIKNMHTLPTARFFNERIEKFADLLNSDDYRCQIVTNGLVNELYIFHKTYMKYLADNFRLLNPHSVTLEEVRKFNPDIALMYGAPEKTLSHPQIGYFDSDGENGKVKTLITPLKKKVDYFGDIKKPRLTLMNEKVKEMGGAPIHGSFFIVESEDGTLFGIMISGDSGVGKSEMLAAMMLKWLQKDLSEIRSIKLIAGDMLHVFPDKHGNLYGIGTEVGDFSRVTDFDPAFIDAYRTLFESSADSNVEDLNSRSTISGFCDIRMPFKIDIILTAQNYAKAEAGILKYSNVENFMLYRDSHGERKEKATSSDNPNFQRTLLRYTADKNIVQVLDKHGNYLDELLTWDYSATDQKFYMASSYKNIDRIDIENIINKIMVNKKLHIAKESFLVDNIKFDIIKNRFNAQLKLLDKNETETSKQVMIDRDFFSSIFNSLASTPGGNPFIDELNENEIRKSLVHVLKGGKNGKGKGKEIQCAILSTDIGKKGKEIFGPQTAAKEVLKLVQEVRTSRPEINLAKNFVKQIIEEKYGWLFKNHQKSVEIERYNFLLYQMEQMRKAKFVRLDDSAERVSMKKLKDFIPLPDSHKFSPILATPNINIELNNYSETYRQLIDLPNNEQFAEKFKLDCPSLYIASGYSPDVKTNNLIVQLLLLHGYINVLDLSRGKLAEKANRETVAAAKYAAVNYLNSHGK
jgi:hypothetical protein